ncbi:pyridoxamine 5'-phosphate oxidase family protein [Acanthopleuribacter pedis]|uniref:Pyridoxamine 5'-phosphate oxidase family protein n=1 Tax=Acanthopleuribacter pedis TaxID=442870 RepID=A0A8J7QP72_9BACT|nr:pyridoxamine 5'-phosphate oxidase family protein [Acanthopleuribacter pedis]MBO1322088.1 pyridoxamine 5'-phosphate oxidase family protein [Acanthopleuribacter pedis]
MPFQERLDDDLCDFIRAQAMFFTGTAPRQGRINLSPKGLDTFRILDQSRVAYLDLTGSGNETAAHINENGRLTMMFCSYDARMLILRLYGRGEVIRPTDAGWAEHAPHFDLLPGYRQIILLHIESVQKSCGFAVPRYQLIGQRDKLIDHAEKKGRDGIEAYQQNRNQVSIDGHQAYPDIPR